METETIKEPVGVEFEQQSLLGKKLKPIFELGKRKLVPLTTVGLLGGLAIINACGGSGSEVPRSTTEPTVLPPTAAASIGSSTAEVPTVIPVETPTATSTTTPIQEAPTQPPPGETVQPTPPEPTASAVPTPEQPSPSTPTPEVTQEVAPKNYTIEIIPPDPTKPSLQAYEKYSEEEAQQIIESVASKYPILGEVKFQLALGGGMGFAGQDQEGKLVIRVDRTNSELKDDLLHELVHSWDFVIIGEADSHLLSLREKILSDPQIGRSYPSLVGVFSGNYTIARMDFQYSNKIFDLEGFKVLTSGYANEYWTRSLGFFDEYLFDENWQAKTTPIESKDPNFPNRVTYASFKDFWQGEAKGLNDLAQTNNKWAAVINEIGSDIDEYQQYAYKLEPKLLGPDRQAAYEWRVLGQLGKLILAEEVLSGEPGVTGLFTPEERDRVDRGLVDAKTAADGEQIAEVVAKYITLTEQGRLSEEFLVVDNFLQAVSSSLE